MKKLYKPNHEDYTFIQGDRDPDENMRNIASQLGEELSKRDVKVNVGSYGGFVKVLQESGVEIYPHVMVWEGKELQFNQDEVESINCIEIAEQMLQNEKIDEEEKKNRIKDVSWALRMGLFLSNSSSFAFFPGTRGTRSHLLSALAFNLTSDKPKPVALIGWDEDDLNLQNHSEYPELKDREDAWLKSFASELREEFPSWLKNFDKEDIDGIVEFLTNKTENND